MNLNWRGLPAAYVPLGSLFSLLTEAKEPVSPSALVLTLAKTQLRRRGTMPLKLVPCNPKLTYCVDNSDQLADGRIVRLARIRSGRNSIQGQFQIRAFTEAHDPRRTRSPTPPISSSTSSHDLNETGLERKPINLQGGGWLKNCSMRRLMLTSTLIFQ
jgi:hypothetical protein